MLLTSAANRARLRSVFFGPHGIRAGWSILVFATLIAPLEVIARILRRDYPSLFIGVITPGNSLVIETIRFFFIIAATAVTGCIEGREVWSYYGLAGPRSVAKLLAGWTGGLVCLSLVVGLLNAAGFLVFDGRDLHGLPIFGNGLIWLLTFLMLGVSEELMYRGYLQATLTRSMGFWPAAIVVSVLFGLGHIPNPGETVVGIIGVTIRALFYCFLLRLTGSLWLGIGFHAAWDWAQSFLFGTPQSGHVMQGHFFSTHPLGAPLMSGGGVGPEGSLLWAPPFVLGLLAFFWGLKRIGLLAAPQASRRLEPAEN